jgi:HK97 family phage prohead protease
MSEQPAGQLEYRQATVVGTSFPDRTIELIVMPYETETVADYKGRMIREIVHPGAFDGIERRANRIRVNRDHDVTRTVGRAVRLHPSRTEGLVAELRIAKTPLGDETLELADEEILDASAGFLPMPGGERWESRDMRHLDRLWLGHIAMTPEPAYQDARVLSVRSQTLTEPPGPIRTPNIEQVYAWRAQDDYDRLSR